MKTHTIALVQASFAKVVPTAHAAAISAFDDSLSRRDPELRALLRGDLGTRGTRLLPMLAFAVNRLGNPDALLPALEKLGRDLPRWDLHERHYTHVRMALLDALAAGLGDEFTPDLRGAWLEAFELVSASLKRATAPLEV